MHTAELTHACLVLFFLGHMTGTSCAAPVLESIGERNVEAASDTQLEQQSLVARVMLGDIMRQVERDSKSVEFSDANKLFVLRQMSIYLFGEDSQARNAFNAHKTTKRHKGMRRLRRSRDVASDITNRLSFTQEYRVLLNLSELLNIEETRNEYVALLAHMQQAG